MASADWAIDSTDSNLRRFQLSLGVSQSSELPVNVAKYVAGRTRSVKCGSTATSGPGAETAQLSSNFTVRLGWHAHTHDKTNAAGVRPTQGLDGRGRRNRRPGASSRPGGAGRGG